MEILLVEDTPADAELARIALQRCAFVGTLTHMPDGERALDWLENGDSGIVGAATPLPRLVLLDLKMPRLGGHEVLRRMKGSARLKRVPVVVFTSSREERDVALAFELGANGYVVKPVEFGAYCEAMRTMLDFWTRVSEPPSFAN